MHGLRLKFRIQGVLLKRFVGLLCFEQLLSLQHVVGDLRLTRPGPSSCISWNGGDFSFAISLVLCSRIFWKMRAPEGDDASVVCS